MIQIFQLAVNPVCAPYRLESPGRTCRSPHAPSTPKSGSPAVNPFRSTSDLTAVRKEVEDFLNAYNDGIPFLKAKTAFNTETDSRGVLAGEGLYRSLRSQLRDIMTSKITYVESGDPQYLAEIGITASTPIIALTAHALQG